VDLKIALGAIVAAVLFFFGIIFAMASAYATTRLLVAAFLFAAGFVVVAVVYVMTRKPKTVIQQLELSGEMKAVALKCPQCSASVEPDQIKIVDGVPFATCKYCGHMFEVTEEPKW
jgi:DNA-directed RNA polymerase subunit RPC12/RpoP